MTLEIARRLGQDGVTWETVVVEEDTGGGMPDPSGEPDGDVLTVSSGAAVWAPSGGSQPILTIPVVLTAAEILALDSQFIVLVEGAPGKVVVPVALLTATATSGSGSYDITDTPYLTDGSGQAVLNGLSLALEAGLNQVSADVLAINSTAPASFVIEGGLAITADSDPGTTGGTPDWGITGTLYYIEFTP